VSVGAKRIAFPPEDPQADRAEIEADIRGRVPAVHAHGRRRPLVERITETKMLPKPEEPKVVKLR
jgi:hypothetical protein